jgi:ubiquinone/menaquinone biosynthesis C-methylase UbiE
MPKVIVSKVKNRKSSMSKKPYGAGKSSFDIVDVGLLFSEVGLQKGSTFLDVACGFGAYSLAVAEIIGASGRIHAFDLWQEGIDELKQQAQARGITHVAARVADVSKHIPLADGSVDVALMAMVFHDLMRDHSEAGALTELRRVIKNQGKLCVIEFKKIDGPPGPPINIRLSPEALESCLLPYGFHWLKSVDLGPYSYLTIFTLESYKEKK